MSVSLREYLETQLQLEQQAAQEYPWDPSECTFHLDVGRQHFYACQTCPGPNAICYACSIQCHTEHDLVEVNAKRDMKCDCGTTRIGGDPCTLRKTGELEKPHENTYSHNFEGRFCTCDKEYGGETMYQCRFGVACKEDWFHEECIPLDKELEGLFICFMCVEAAEIEYLAEFPFAKSVEAPESRTGGKRERPRVSLVLEHDFTEKLAASKDSRIVSLISKYPYLGCDEKEYEKVDEDAQESLLEAGMKALDKLDHQVAVAGIERFTEFRENFAQFFKSWDSSKVISASDIQEFYASLAK